MTTQNMSRRHFLAMTAASAVATKAGPARKQVPVGALVYAVIDDWNTDPDATAVALARMGFTGLEVTNYMPQWDTAKCKAFRKVMDANELKCYATHTEPRYFVRSDDMKKMIEMNHILGTQTISCVRGLAASAMPAVNNPDSARDGGGRSPRAAKKGGGNEIGHHPRSANEADGWKELADMLQNAAVMLKREKFVLSFHNHSQEFQYRKNGAGRPIDILANAPDLVFTPDTNVAVRAGSDIVAFIKQYPGMYNSLLLTDGPNDADGHVPALGKGDLPWNNIFDAAEGPGGIKFYLLTHGPSIAPGTTRMDAIKADLAQYRIIHGKRPGSVQDDRYRSAPSWRKEPAKSGAVVKRLGGETSPARPWRNGLGSEDETLRFSADQFLRPISFRCRSALIGTKNRKCTCLNVVRGPSLGSRKNHLNLQNSLGRPNDHGGVFADGRSRSNPAIRCRCARDLSFPCSRLDEEYPIGLEHQKALAQYAITEREKGYDQPLPAEILDCAGYGWSAAQFQLDATLHWYGLWAVSNEWTDVSDIAPIKEQRSYVSLERPYRFLQAINKKLVDEATLGVTAAVRKQVPVLRGFNEERVYVESSNKKLIHPIGARLQQLVAEIIRVA